VMGNVPRCCNFSSLFACRAFLVLIKRFPSRVFLAIRTSPLQVESMHFFIKNGEIFAIELSSVRFMIRNLGSSMSLALSGGSGDPIVLISWFAVVLSVRELKLCVETSYLCGGLIRTVLY